MTRLFSRTSWLTRTAPAAASAADSSSSLRLASSSCRGSSPIARLTTKSRFTCRRGATRGEMQHHGGSWCGIMRWIMVDHGGSWWIMVDHGGSWWHHGVASCGGSWWIMVDHGGSWWIMGPPCAAPRARRWSGSGSGSGSGAVASGQWSGLGLGCHACSSTPRCVHDSTGVSGTEISP